jgi:hypothetical protein
LKKRFTFRKAAWIKRIKYKSKKKDEITELMEMDDLLNESETNSDEFSTILSDDNYY